MPSLRELQRSLSAATLSHDPAAVATLPIVRGTLDPGERIGIYRNNVLGNYRKVLAATYPVVRRLVGVPFFEAAVNHFVRRYRSTRGDVNHYGDAFAAFLTSYPPAHELAYLPDVARLEWAVDQANIAADAAPLDVAALAAVPLELRAELRFVLQPSAQLLASAYPILRIWRVNQPGHTGDDRVDLGEGGDTVIVVRNERGVTIEPVGAGDYALLAALAAGARLDAAAEQASAAEPGFDLAQALRSHVANQVIAPRATAGSLAGDNL
jgi:hypothetical protein